MKHFLLLGPACALAVAFGCGPMKVPLPQRLDPETQLLIDNGWNRALSPPDKLGHQELLDVLVGTQLYQLGVDFFMFRAEKRFARGKVVMEVAFDRASPDDDRFQVTVLDSAGKVVRAENYSRKEVDQTYLDLFEIPHGDSGLVKVAPEVRAGHSRRWEKILSHFPKPEERKDEEAPKPRQKG
jgi:hypothetical protein